MRNMEGQHQKSASDHYNNTMYLQKDERNEVEMKRRHDQEQALNTNLITKKSSEKEGLLGDLDNLNQQYLAMAELQASIAEAASLREKIEDAKVKIQMMDVTVKVLGEANDYLARRREELQEEKSEAEHKREELRTAVKAQDDIAAKRLQNKLQRDKTQEAKELLAQEELIILANEDLENKLRDEKKKFEDLLSGRQDIEEKLKRRTAKMIEDKEAVEV